MFDERRLFRSPGVLAGILLALLVVLAVLLFFVFPPKSNDVDFTYIDTSTEDSSSLPLADTETARAVSTAERFPACDGLLAEYKQDAERFLADVAAYRQSMPVYEQYMRLLEGTIAPLQTRGEQCLEELRRAGMEPKGRDFADVEVPVIKAFTYTFSDFSLEFLKDASCRRLNVKEKDLSGLSNLIQNPIIQKITINAACPFTAGTPEYKKFYARYELILVKFTRMCTPAVSALPPYLEERRQKLLKRREALIVFAPFQEEMLPEPVDPYSRKIEEISQGLPERDVPLIVIRYNMKWIYQRLF